MREVCNEMINKWMGCANVSFLDVGDLAHQHLEARQGRSLTLLMTLPVWR